MLTTSNRFFSYDYGSNKFTLTIDLSQCDSDQATYLQCDFNDLCSDFGFTTRDDSGVKYSDVNPNNPIAFKVHIRSGCTFYDYNLNYENIKIIARKLLSNPYSDTNYKFEVFLIYYLTLLNQLQTVSTDTELIPTDHLSPNTLLAGYMNESFQKAHKDDFGKYLLYTAGAELAWTGICAAAFYGLWSLKDGSFFSFTSSVLHNSFTIIGLSFLLFLALAPAIATATIGTKAANESLKSSKLEPFSVYHTDYGRSRISIDGFKLM